MGQASVRLSRRSTAAAGSACGGFAAERPAGGRYRSLAGTGAQKQRRSGTAPSSNFPANAGTVMLTAE